MAWLMIQHADADLPLEKKCLERMKSSVKQGEAAGVDLAYLTDRVLAAESEKLPYGTQLEQKEGRLVPKPVEDAMYNIPKTLHAHVENSPAAPTYCRKRPLGALHSTRSKTVKYVLLMKFNIAGWQAGNRNTWQPEDIKANIDFVRRFNQELADAGELVSSEGLGGPEQIRVVQATKDAAPTVTDGPFPESKEFLAGYWMVDVASPERAVEIAARLSAIPGPGAAPANIPIEVRPVMSGSRDV